MPKQSATNKLPHTLLAIALLCVSNISTAQVTAKIIGGNVADSNAWPWMTGLIFKNRASSFQGQYCGGSLISKQWVLTAAHCVQEQNKTTIDVVINQPNLTINTGERLAIERIILHPLFNDITLDNDIALIKLNRPSRVTPIGLLSSNSTQDNAQQPAIALGWGTTSTDAESVKKFPKQLRQIELPIVNNSTCAFNLTGITNNVLCAGFYSEIKDTCQGDSGGPLIVFDNTSKSWHQAGITSWGNGCATAGFYGVYTRVKNYRSFIANTICSARETPHPPILTLNFDQNNVTATWNRPSKATGYWLSYAPYPEGKPILTIDVNEATQFSTTLSAGSAYYVAISSYNTDDCLSSYSNIEHFTIK